jgi:hypothetical protein
VKHFKFVVNYLKMVVDAIIDRLRIRSVSLHVGSHRDEYGLNTFISDFVIEESSDLVICVKDPLIEGFIHRHVFTDRAIFRLRHATFDPNHGNVFLGKLLVRESHSDTSKLSIRMSASACETTNQPIIGVKFETFYHWLIETLPRVIAASKLEPKAVLIAPSQLSKNQRHAIEALGHEVRYSDARHYSEDLILASRGRDSGWAHPADLRVLRSTYGVPTSRGSIPIFISRVGSSRSDALSQTIHEFAKSSGWNVIKAEELTWDETLRVFGQASVIAGEHGAGLANIALAPLATHLIDLQRSDYVNPCYAALSQSLNGNESNYSSYPLDQYRKALTL